MAYYSAGHEWRGLNYTAEDVALFVGRDHPDSPPCNASGTFRIPTLKR